MGIVVRDEGKKVNSDINVTPMVDVMLVLLIIFMLVTPMLQNKVNVDLAKTQSAVPLPDADHEDSVKVAVTRDGKVYLGANQVSLADLGPKAQDLLQNKPDKTVYIRADARARYGIVMDAIDNLRTAGVDQAAFLTEPEPAPATQKVPGAPNPPATPAPAAAPGT
jgi:biopolymer transport protein TolR